jgi:hypothetical protein
MHKRIAKSIQYVLNTCIIKNLRIHVQEQEGDYSWAVKVICRKGLTSNIETLGKTIGNINGEGLWVKIGQVNKEEDFVEFS